MELETIFLKLLETNKKVHVMGKKHSARGIVFPRTFKTYEEANKAIKIYNKHGIKTKTMSSCGNIYLAKVGGV